MTNVCFAEAKSLVLGHGIDKNVHAYVMVEIVLVFKGWFYIVKTRLGLGAIW